MMMQIDKARLATAVAGMLEWYDFSIFGFMAVEIGANFFAEDEEASSDSLMATLGVFGGGFVARPLGGIIFGHVGDVGYGSAARGEHEPLEVRRLRALEGSLLVMAVAATALAVLPNRTSIGTAAPVLMLVVRLLQGLSVGGQLTGALLAAAEKAPTGRELGTTATLLAACNSGILLGATVSFLCHAAFSDAQLIDWAWRVPFALGALLSLGAYGAVRALRPRSTPHLASESSTTAAEAASDGPAAAAPTVGGSGCHAAATSSPPPPSATSASGASPLRVVLGCAAGRRKLVACVCAWGLHTCTFYTAFLFLPLFLVDFLGLPSAPAHGLTSVLLLLACVLVPLVGRLADASLARRLDARYGVGALAASSMLTPSREQERRIHESREGRECEAIAGACGGDGGAYDGGACEGGFPARLSAMPTPRGGLWAPASTRTVQAWLGWRTRCVALSLSLASPLALWLAQLGAQHVDRAPVAAWSAVLTAAAVLVLHSAIIDGLVGAWLLSVFAPEVRYSAVALSLNVATMLFAGPAPAVEAALAGTAPSSRWTAGLFVSLVAIAAALCTEIGEDPIDDRRALIASSARSHAEVPQTPAPGGPTSSNH